MVIIYTNFVQPESSMLYAKFQDHRTSGSDGNLCKFLPYMAIWRQSRACELDHLYKLLFPLPWKIHMKFGYDWLSSFRGEDL